MLKAGVQHKVTGFYSGSELVQDLICAAVNRILGCCRSWGKKSARQWNEHGRGSGVGGRAQGPPPKDTQTVKEQENHKILCSKCCTWAALGWSGSSQFNPGWPTKGVLFLQLDIKDKQVKVKIQRFEKHQITTPCNNITPTNKPTNKSSKTQANSAKSTTHKGHQESSKAKKPRNTSKNKGKAKRLL